MAEKEYVMNGQEATVERSSEHIRQEIAKDKENLAQTVDQIGEQLKERLDWREYVKDSPYWAIGVAAGVGYLAASRAFRPRATPMERMMDAMTGHVHDALGGMIVGAAGPGLIKMTLLGIATKAAAGVIKNVISTDWTRGGARPQTKETQTTTNSTL